MSDDRQPAVALVLSRGAERSLRKLKRRDPATFKQVSRKIMEIRERPEMGSPKRHHLTGYRGVHVGPMVILYRWDAETHEVHILKISHHNHAYG